LHQDKSNELLYFRILVKKNTGKKKDEEDASQSFTYISSFTAQLQELDSIAKQHEVCYQLIIMSLLELHSIFGLSFLLKFSAVDIWKLRCRIDFSVILFSKAFKDAEVAYIKYDKAEKNMDLSRADLERAKSNANQRNQQCEEAKKNYAHALEAANSHLSTHYSNMLPAALEQLRLVDEERIIETHKFMIQSIESEVKVMAIMQRCYEDMTNAANQISSNTDSAAVVEQFRTGYGHPEAFTFEDLGSPAAKLSGEGTSTIDTLKRPRRDGTATRVHRKASGLFRGTGKKDGTIESLPPQQRCRRLVKEMEKIQKDIEKSEQSCDALRKMFQVYTFAMVKKREIGEMDTALRARDNPKLGNAKAVEAEIAVHKKKIDSLMPQLTKYKEMLSAAQTELNVPISALNSGTPRSVARPSSGRSTPSQVSPGHSGTISRLSSANVQRGSYSGESASSSGSFGISPSPNHLVEAQHLEKTPVSTGAPLAEKAEVYEEEVDELPVLGMCRALYAFEGGSEGTMPMIEGDEMALIERDEGDGWTRVRNLATGKEGFVPTTYLECRWYPEK
uniref:SH3 domain-containing protein n=1 Tax=Enterobius vermicularis TaxID=51028 RepID=A0A0N4V290_ENTVE